MLILAHPLHTHGPPYGLREKQRIRRGIVAAIGAIGTRAVHVNHAQLVLRHPESLRERVPKSVRALGGCPDRRAISAHIGDSARRSERGVALARPLVSGGKLLSCAGHCRPWVAAIHYRFVTVDHALAHMPVQR